MRTAKGGLPTRSSYHSARSVAFSPDGNSLVFGVMPIFWKAWLLVILAAMIGAFVYVAQNTVRVGH